MSEIDYCRNKVNSSKQSPQLRKPSNNRKKLLESIPKSKMSSNVKDYLSVERISIQEMEQSLMNQKSRLLRNYRLSNLLGFKDVEQEVESYHSADIKKTVPFISDNKIEKPVFKRPIKFKPPFDTYYYRDFLWKIGFSNGFIVEPV